MLQVLGATGRGTNGAQTQGYGTRGYLYVQTDCPEGTHQAFISTQQYQNVYMSGWVAHSAVDTTDVFETRVTYGFP